MKLISQKANKQKNAWHTTYEISSHLSAEDILSIIAVLKSLDVKTGWCRLSNNEVDSEHLFRTFQSCEEAEHFLDFEYSDWIIDDFGCSCSYRNLSFELTVDIGRDWILFFYHSDTQVSMLEDRFISILNEIEMVLQNKNAAAAQVCEVKHESEPGLPPKEVEAAVLRIWEYFPWETKEKIQNASADADFLCEIGGRYCFYIPKANVFYTVERDGNYYHGYETIITRIDKSKALDLLYKRAEDCRRCNGMKELAQAEQIIKSVTGFGEN